MAKASRSNKKQPAFDPSELEDLIFSPAVGKGVGSHLVSRTHVTTVVTSAPSTIVNQLPPEVTTVVAPDLSTVATSNTSQNSYELPPPPAPQPATSPPAELARPVPPSQRNLWITENGDLIPEARVKRIRLAQDVINSAEECVYDTLWNAKLLQADERDSCRIVQAGYDYLVKRSRLSRKTIQRIIAKLLEKDFIAIETRADIYQRSSTVYRVFSYKAVLEKHVRKGRLHVAKMGPGFSYAQPLAPAEIKEVRKDTNMTTVVTSELPTIAGIDMTTMVPETTVTVVKMDRSTVVKMSPYLLDAVVLDSTSSLRFPQVRKALSVYGQVDDDVVQTIVQDCRIQAPDCSEEEIIHFIHEKGGHVKKRESRIHNPIGFLATAVPKCFAGEGFQEYRQRRTESRDRAFLRESEEDATMQKWRREQEATLSDPSVSEQEKHLIRLCLGLNTG